MQWSEVLEDRSLRNLPYKIETNRFGQIVMSPASANHSEYQSTVLSLLDPMKPNGKVYCEIPIGTPDGVKVPDVAWASESRRAMRRPEQTTFSVAPELCIEVLSRSNSVSEIDEKKLLYFRQGADEVWTCDMTGKVTFFDAEGRIERSRLFPQFPSQI